MAILALTLEQILVAILVSFSLILHCIYTLHCTCIYLYTHIELIISIFSFAER